MAWCRPEYTWGCGGAGLSEGKEGTSPVRPSSFLFSNEIGSCEHDGMGVSTCACVCLRASICYVQTCTCAYVFVYAYFLPLLSLAPSHIYLHPRLPFTSVFTFTPACSHHWSLPCLNTFYPFTHSASHSVTIGLYMMQLHDQQHSHVNLTSAHSYICNCVYKRTHHSHPPTQGWWENKDGKFRSMTSGWTAAGYLTRVLFCGFAFKLFRGARTGAFHNFNDRASSVCVLCSLHLCYRCRITLSIGASHILSTCNSSL